MNTSEATAEIFFTAFKALKTREKEAFLEKVVKDGNLREDLIEIALIEKAKKVKGVSVSAREYFALRKTRENAA